ncbi:MAG: ABC transporter substrate-binding protein [Deltaproteobacteria bacterium]|nr:ABC transporter substrate-binding protein [Deltaproteobacteria bacterium]
MSMGRKLFISIFALVLLAGFVLVSGQAMAAEEKKPEQFVGILAYRTGPFAAGGSGFSSGMEDFMALTNAKGGINGKIMYKWAECETAYNTARGVECYNRFKDKMVFVHPLSTGITYALIPKGTKDKIAVISSGYGRADASDGRVFPWVFTTPTNYWSQNTAKIKWIAMRQGWDGKDMSTIGKSLKGLKIANLHIDVPYGQETKPILDKMAAKFGFTVRHFPVPWPGIDQKAQWMDIVRRYKADWVINRNWGVSCTVPLKEAARLNFPREKVLGVWWCGSEEDVMPAGKAAKGYYTTNFHGVGRDFPIIQEVVDKVYGAMKGNIAFTRVGTIYYNRGFVAGIMNHEAILTAQKKYGVKVLTGDEFRWGLENLNVTEARIKEIGAEGLMQPMKNSCADHEGGGKVFFQQWDGKKWVSTGEVVTPMKKWVREMIEESAAKYAKEKGITPRKCK